MRTDTILANYGTGIIFIDPIENVLSKTPPMRFSKTYLM